MPRRVADESQIFLQDVHVLPKRPKIICLRNMEQRVKSLNLVKPKNKSVIKIKTDLFLVYFYYT
jgi:hypothetical protein